MACNAAFDVDGVMRVVELSLYMASSNLELTRAQHSTAQHSTAQHSTAQHVAIHANGSGNSSEDGFGTGRQLKNNPTASTGLSPALLLHTLVYT